MGFKDMLPDEGTRSLMTNDNFMKIVYRDNKSPEKAWEEVKKVFGGLAYPYTLEMAKQHVEETSLEARCVMQVLALSPQNKQTIKVLDAYLKSTPPFTGNAEQLLRTMATTKSPEYADLYLDELKRPDNAAIPVAVGGLLEIAKRSPEIKDYIKSKVTAMIKETGKPKTDFDAMLQGHRTGLLQDLGEKTVDSRYPYWIVSEETDIRKAAIRKLK